MVLIVEPMDKIGGGTATWRGNGEIGGWARARCAISADARGRGAQDRPAKGIVR